MSFLKNLFNKPQDTPIESYADFWQWFQANEATFAKLVRKGSDPAILEEHFFDPLSEKLGELKDGFYYLTGMYDDDIVELVFTPDGVVKNIVFIEELVDAAPDVKGWKFTALKPALGIEDVGIGMNDYTFNGENIFFYSNDQKDFPDEIDITVVYEDMNEEDRPMLTNGVFIFLDNFLGELNFATKIDEIKIVGKDEAKQELVPIAKLKPFLIWREKEFIERYEGSRYDTDNDNYAMFEATLEDGNPLMAIINTDLLKWENKASHPWMMNIKIEYESENQGLPDKPTYELLNVLEGEIIAELKDSEGYLNIGRETADGTRLIYFACKDFRLPSKVAHEVLQKYADRLSVDYNIYKDKYWQSFQRFVTY